MAAEIRDHVATTVDEMISVRAIDEPGPGGAHHHYVVAWPECGGRSAVVHFQEGPVKEVGVNGLTNEALLAIVQHRLECFQAGEFSSRENALALTSIQNAMHWLHHRTRNRVSRGVEGKSVA